MGSPCLFSGPEFDFLTDTGTPPVDTGPDVE